MYPEEDLDPEWEDNGSMPSAKDDLADLVVGHRIVSAELSANSSKNYWDDVGDALILTLDSGKRVKMQGFGDCCAGAEVTAFLAHPERVNHVITGVGTTGGYTTWHIYADMGDVLELSVSWSCGNAFYYGYGFTFTVEDLDGLS